MTKASSFRSMVCYWSAHLFENWGYLVKLRVLDERRGEMPFLTLMTLDNFSLNWLLRIFLCSVSFWAERVT